MRTLVSGFIILGSLTLGSGLKAQTSTKTTASPSREEILAIMKARQQEREEANRKRVEYRDSVAAARLRVRDSLAKRRAFLRDSAALDRKMRRDSLTYGFKMKDAIHKLENTIKPEDLEELSKTFRSIGDKERMRWMPYYYVAFTQVLRARQAIKKQNFLMAKDGVFKADEMLKVVRKRYGDNIETLLLQKVIYQLRWTSGGKNTYSTGGAPGLAVWSDAYAIDAKNPRVLLLKGQDLLYGPSKYAGDKERGIAYLKEALKQFEKYKPVMNLPEEELAFYPSWGKELTEEILQKEGVKIK